MSDNKRHDEYIAEKMFQLIELIGQISAASRCVGYKDTEHMIGVIRGQTLVMIDRFDKDKNSGQ